MIVFVNNAVFAILLLQEIGISCFAASSIIASHEGTIEGEMTSHDMHKYAPCNAFAFEVSSASWSPQEGSEKYVNVLQSLQIDEGWTAVFGIQVGHVPIGRSSSAMMLTYAGKFHPHSNSRDKREMIAFESTQQDVTAKFLNAGIRIAVFMLCIKNPTLTLIVSDEKNTEKKLRHKSESKGSGHVEKTLEILTFKLSKQKFSFDPSLAFIAAPQSVINVIESIFNEIRLLDTASYDTKVGAINLVKCKLNGAKSNDKFIDSDIIKLSYQSLIIQKDEICYFKIHIVEGINHWIFGVPFLENKKVTFDLKTGEIELGLSSCLIARKM